MAESCPGEDFYHVQVNSLIYSVRLLLCELPLVGGCVLSNRVNIALLRALTRRVIGQYDHHTVARVNHPYSMQMLRGFSGIDSKTNKETSVVINEQPSTQRSGVVRWRRGTFQLQIHPSRETVFVRNF